MQFQTIITSLVLAVAVSAAPAPAPNAPTGQDAQNHCAAGQVAACCNSANLLSILGGSCSPLNLLTLISDQCNPQQTVACCASNPNQVGLINVAVPCTQVPVDVL